MSRLQLFTREELRRIPDTFTTATGDTYHAAIKASVDRWKAKCGANWGHTQSNRISLSSLNLDDPLRPCISCWGEEARVFKEEEGADSLTLREVFEKRFVVSMYGQGSVYHDPETVKSFGCPAIGWSGSASRLDDFSPYVRPPNLAHKYRPCKNCFKDKKPTTKEPTVPAPAQGRTTVYLLTNVLNNKTIVLTNKELAEEVAAFVGEDAVKTDTKRVL